MKNKIVRFGLSAVCAAAMLLATPVTALAAESNYTYVYDYWEDVQECPDVYSVAKVFTYKDLGLEQNLKAPESLYVDGNLVYICDTGNNRIVVLERNGSNQFSVVREFSSINGSDKPDLNAPADIAVGSDGSLFIADRGNGRVVKVDQDLNYLMEFT